jgi:hypothetical protein
VIQLSLKQKAARIRARLAALAFMATTFVLVLGPATAGAQNVTDAQYSSTLQLISQNQTTPDETSSGGGGLPFTGLDVMALFVVGAALALVGFVLWRRSRSVSGTAGLR